MGQAMRTASSWRSTPRCASWLKLPSARRQTCWWWALQTMGKFRYSSFPRAFDIHVCGRGEGLEQAAVYRGSVLACSAPLLMVQVNLDSGAQLCDLHTSVVLIIHEHVFPLQVPSRPASMRRRALTSWRDVMQILVLELPKHLESSSSVAPHFAVSVSDEASTDAAGLRHSHIHRRSLYLCYIST